MADSICVRPSPIDGLGVFAKWRFRQDNVVLAIDDSRIVDDDHPLKGHEEERHCDYLESGKVILMKTPERHINHSCDPNTYVKTRDQTRQVIARRGIAKDEEITYDYSINGYGDTVWSCHCGAVRCRHLIHSDFFHLPLALQAEYLPLIDDWFRRERQTQIKLLERALRASLCEGPSPSSAQSRQKPSANAGDRRR